MIIINVKENESIDKALKRFKKKFERTGVLKKYVQDLFMRSRASREGMFALKPPTGKKCKLKKVNNPLLFAKKSLS